MLLAQFTLPILMHLSPIELPHYASLNLGTQSLAFAAALVFLCAVMFSLVPALEIRRARLNDALRVNPAQVAGERNPAQKFLVIGEVPTSVILLAAAALLMTSFRRLAHTPPGFDPSNVLTFKTTFTDQQIATSAGLG